MTSPTNESSPFYNYTPVQWVNLQYLCFYELLFLVGILQLIKNYRAQHNDIDSTKKFKYMVITIPFLVGCMVEGLGYGIRYLSVTHSESLLPYVSSTFLILNAPALYTTSIYMMFGEVVRILNASAYATMPLNYITIIFVVGEIISMLLEFIGACLVLSKNSGNAFWGQLLTKCSPIWHLGCVASFVVILSVFMFKSLRSPTEVGKIQSVNSSMWNDWRLVLVRLLVATLLIMVRSIYRCVEFLQGFNGYVMQHEAFVFILDAGSLLLASVVLLFANTSSWLCDLRYFQETSLYPSELVMVNRYNNEIMF
ncbi:hypothetical protein PGUG_00528 [Meyerozyma guilliermondii ATCC 6260]|uniref:Protein RTA1 n=1 Tax=Meyerozyma guilliermondii (strain ATCC 6260 / CBS 566 / DSM 6381 / JCM 1539 / NBRC 10279 / NRRL Y-324) TaxID=294746 RepID=A5DB73_PICGU|nr:uncharacterized protein PGUG_00528 [Meyerozyma guilliermondii ATCC 6260]EDK36430.2 hypothetical protein PGUG_00528 [Meyerozyma guilliermondii ATCC 6260]